MSWLVFPSLCIRPAPPHPHPPPFLLRLCSIVPPHPLTSLSSMIPPWGEGGIMHRFLLWIPELRTIVVNNVEVGACWWNTRCTIPDAYCTNAHLSFPRELCALWDHIWFKDVMVWSHKNMLLCMFVVLSCGPSNRLTDEDEQIEEVLSDLSLNLWSWLIRHVDWEFNGRSFFFVVDTVLFL